MSAYRYVSVLRALNDGKPPNDNIEEGDEVVKPGKHDDDQITYLTDDGEIAAINFERSELLDSGAAQYSESEIMDWAADELSNEEGDGKLSPKATANGGESA